MTAPIASVDLVKRLRDHDSELQEDRCWALHYEEPEGRLWGEAADEIEQLQTALQYVAGGLAKAYDAASKKFNDETLLHLGHLEAHVAAALRNQT